MIVVSSAFCVSAKKNNKFSKLQPVITKHKYYYNGDSTVLELSAKIKKGGRKYKKLHFVFYYKNGKKYYPIDKSVSGHFGKSKKFVTESVGEGYIGHYKVRAYIKKGKKKIYSKMSPVKNIFHGNYEAKYKIKSLTSAGVYKNAQYLDVVLKLTSSNKYNATTIIKNSSSLIEASKDWSHKNPLDIFMYDYPVYGSSKKNSQGKVETKEYIIAVKEYSKDNKTWKTIPVSGVKLKKKKSIYIKATLINLNYPDEPNIEYAGNDGKNYCESWFYASETFIDYRNIYHGYMYAGGFDLIKETGKIHKVDD